MRRVPLEEYKIPRIMTVDFTEREVKKIVEAGFDVRRAYSGLYDKDEYCIPSALQDIEIALIKYSRETLINFDERKRSEDSVLEEFDIHMMIKEIWGKHGWSVIFINDDTSPDQLEDLGIEDIGLGKHYGRYVSGACSAVSSH